MKHKQDKKKRERQLKEQREAEAREGSRRKAEKQKDKEASALKEEEAQKVEQLQFGLCNVVKVTERDGKREQGIVQGMLDAKADVNAVYVKPGQWRGNGMTALNWASYKGHRQTAKLLMAANANPTIAVTVLSGDDPMKKVNGMTAIKLAQEKLKGKAQSTGRGLVTDIKAYLRVVTGKKSRSDRYIHRVAAIYHAHGLPRKIGPKVKQILARPGNEHAYYIEACDEFKHEPGPQYWSMTKTFKYGGKVEVISEGLEDETGVGHVAVGIRGKVVADGSRGDAKVKFEGYKLPVRVEESEKKFLRPLVTFQTG